MDTSAPRVGVGVVPGVLQTLVVPSAELVGGHGMTSVGGTAIAQLAEELAPPALSTSTEYMGQESPSREKDQDPPLSRTFSVPAEDVATQPNTCRTGAAVTPREAASVVTVDSAT